MDMEKKSLATYFPNLYQVWNNKLTSVENMGECGEE